MEAMKLCLKVSLLTPTTQLLATYDPSLTEGVAPGQRAIPYIRLADGMPKNGSHDIMDVVEGRITLDEFVS